MKLRWTLEKIEDILKEYKWNIDSQQDNIYKISLKSDISEITTFLTVVVKCTTIDITSLECIVWKGIRGYKELEKAIKYYTETARRKK